MKIYTAFSCYLILSSSTLFGNTEEASPKAEDFKFSFDYNFQGLYNNNKVENTTTHNAEPSSRMSIEQFSFDASHRLSETLTVNLNADLSPDNSSYIQEGKLNFSPTKELKFSFGKGIIKQGGFENLHDIPIFSISQFSNNFLPIKSLYGPVFEFTTKASGDLTLQLTNDVTTDPADINAGGFPYFSKTNKQPAVFLEWMARFGRIVPLIRLGSYDIHHSSIASFGFSVNFANLNLKISHTTDNRSEKIQRPGEIQPEGLNHRRTFTYIYGDFYAPLQLNPFFTVTIFDNKQPEDEQMGRTDQKANSSLTTWDDNEKKYGLGIRLQKFGPALQPYLAFEQRTGDFYSETGSVESKSNVMVYLGATGQL